MIAQWYFRFGLSRVKKFVSGVVNSSPNGETVFQSEEYVLLEHAVNDRVDAPKAIKESFRLVRDLQKLCGELELEIFYEDFRATMNEVAKAQVHFETGEGEQTNN